MSANRIYVVVHDGKQRLVEAVNAVAAIQHCAKPKYVAIPAKPRDIAELMANGVKVEVAVQER